ncbi:MAG: chemotaxis protein CheW [Thermodesulfobacteriota bacterium]
MRKQEKIEKEYIQITVFNLSKEEYGLDIEQVYEVMRLQEIHPLPQAPEFIEGVINLRGYIIAVIDLRKRFNIEAIENNPKTRIIICKIKGMIVGLIVDKVSEVLSVSRENIKPTPRVVSVQIQTAYIAGVVRLGERVIILLNLEEILTKEDIKGLASVSE